jgi:hypothetical protein
MYCETLALTATNTPWRRISDLERESEDLRRKLRASQPADPHPSPIALLTAAAELGVHTPASDSLSETPQPPPSYAPGLLVPTNLGHGAPGPLFNGDTTKPRTLNGIQVSADEIDDLFQMYV